MRAQKSLPDAGVFSLVKSEKFYMQIVAQIRGRIADGTLAAGERLPTERELCASFGASRASIREALSALEILGAIESRGRGKYIHVPSGNGVGQTPSRAAASSATTARSTSSMPGLAIEPEMAALAAERATREDIRSLSAQLALLESIRERIGARPGRLEKAAEEYLEADRRFHLLIGRAAHNRVLDRFFSGIHHTLRRSHWKLLRRKVALTDRQPEAAEQGARLRPRGDLREERAARPLPHEPAPRGPAAGAVLSPARA